MNIMKAAKKSDPPVLPEQIRERLATAKAKFAALTAKQFELAEQSVQSPEVEKSYLAVIDEMSATSADISRFELALSAMETRAAKAAADDQVAEISALRGRVVGMLDRRVVAAQTFEAAIGEAVHAMRLLAGLSKEVWAAWPGQQPQGGIIFGPDELGTLIAAEMYRQGGVVIPTGGVSSGPTQMALPAPRAPTIASFNVPEAIPPLTTAIEQANTYAKQMLGGAT